MTKVTPPKVTVLASGTELIAKQMQAKAGDLLPKHLANIESVLFIHEGEILLDFEKEEISMKSGDAVIIPADAIHQIKVVSDLKGVHLMPKDIEFKFFA